MFENSNSGDNIAAAAQLECGICWWMYDPQVGDPLAYIPPGTPFAALPEQWRCPNCDAPKHKFMVM